MRGTHWKTVPSSARTRPSSCRSVERSLPQRMSDWLPWVRSRWMARQPATRSSSTSRPSGGADRRGPSRPGWARSWSATTPGSPPTCAASTPTARRSGINSIRRDLPADITQAQARRRPSTSSTPTPSAPATSCSCRCPSTSTRTPRWSGSTRARTPTGCTRSTWAGWCSASRRRCPAPRAASCTCCAATRSRSPARRSWSSAAGSRSAGRSGCC